MADFITILKAIFSGFVTGLILSLPLGPAGVESIKRTISCGFKTGFKVSIGAITADVSYLFLINCGLSNVINSNKKTESIFWIISGLLLIIIGLSSIKSNSKKESDNSNFLCKKVSSFPFLIGFIITFTNPMTPSLWFFMSATAIKHWHRISFSAYSSFIIALILGMITWFALLNYLVLKGVNILNPKSSNKTLHFVMWILVILGIFFTGFGFTKLVQTLL